MQTLFKPGNRVLAVAALLALVVLIYPPWVSMVQGGSLGMGGEIIREDFKSAFLGYAPLWSPPESNDPTCNTIEFACWSFMAWQWIGLELLVVAALAAVGWMVDRPRRPARA